MTSESMSSTTVKLSSAEMNGIAKNPKTIIIRIILLSNIGRINYVKSN